jgi:flagellin-like hook-associated protein FlgL
MTKHQTQQSKDSIDQILQEIDNILETPSFADAEILNRYFSK